MVEEILNNGYAYESNGSIYFDVEKYNKDHHYGILSHRNLEDIINNSRELAGVGEKRHQADFALWKKAQPEHIMRWPIDIKYKDGTEADGKPHYREFVSNGFPGWHCECTAMSRKYLGNHFDILRNRTGCGQSGRPDGALLDAQQHDHHQRAEDGQESG